jgi:hypothetical protein
MNKDCICRSAKRVTSAQFQHRLIVYMFVCWEARICNIRLTSLHIFSLLCQALQGVFSLKQYRSSTSSLSGWQKHQRFCEGNSQPRLSSYANVRSCQELLKLAAKLFTLVDNLAAARSQIRLSFFRPLIPSPFRSSWRLHLWARSLQNYQAHLTLHVPLMIPLLQVCCCFWNVLSSLPIDCSSYRIQHCYRWWDMDPSQKSGSLHTWIYSSRSADVHWTSGIQSSDENSNETWSHLHSWRNHSATFGSRLAMIKMWYFLMSLSGNGMRPFRCRISFRVIDA